MILIHHYCHLRFLFLTDPRTAIHLAAREGHVDVLKALLQEQSEEQKKRLVNQADNNGITPVFLTIQKCEAQVHSTRPWCEVSYDICTPPYYCLF